MATLTPLVVDLDGSLLRSDSLHESVAANLRHPGTLLRASLALRRGRAAVKRELAPAASETLQCAPLNEAVVAFVDAAAESGREVVLATGADETVAREIAARVPAIGDVMASDGVTNLTGRRKADALVARYGDGGFDYIGNAAVDEQIWNAADLAYLATTRRDGVPAWTRGRAFAGTLRDPRPSPARAWSRALRVHQSLKNVLLFLPLVASHSFTDSALVARAGVGFVAFTLMASAVYLLNDTLDIASDRAHPRKRLRPIAAGWISPLLAMMVSILLVVSGLLVGSVLGTAFMAVLVTYAVMTTTYSFWLKRVAVVDIVMLALLYMVRIVAGAIATGITLSFWFTGVTLFLFLSLALVKRYAEAHQAKEAGRDIRGRGYSGDDVHAILALGAGTGVASVLLMAIYIQSDAVSALYPAPVVLWLVIPLYFSWIAHLWLTAGRGQVHDDPLVFALRDPASLVTGGLVVVVFTIASLPGAAALLHGMGT